jgi:hypothetical protein
LAAAHLAAGLKLAGGGRLEAEVAREVREEQRSGGEAAASEASARIRRLAELLSEWEQLERARGSAEFDPWALQEIRNEIRTAVKRDPVLGLASRD